MALILDQINEGLAMLILAVEVQAGFLEKAQEAFEVVDTQAALGLDQFVQGRGSCVNWLEVQEQLDLIVADLVTNHLFLIFTHYRLQPADIYTGLEVYLRDASSESQAELMWELACLR